LQKGDRRAVRYVRNEAEREFKEIDAIARWELLAEFPKTVDELLTDLEGPSEGSNCALTYGEALGATHDCVSCGETIVDPYGFAERAQDHYRLSGRKAEEACDRIVKAVYSSGVETGDLDDSAVGDRLRPIGLGDLAPLGSAPREGVLPRHRRAARIRAQLEMGGHELVRALASLVHVVGEHARAAGAPVGHLAGRQFLELHVLALGKTAHRGSVSSRSATNPPSTLRATCAMTSRWAGESDCHFLSLTMRKNTNVECEVNVTVSVNFQRWRFCRELKGTTIMSREPFSRPPANVP
jgi:hypothetical protein